MIPKYNEMYNEVLQVLSDGKEYSIKELVYNVSNLLGLDDSDKSELMENGKTTVIYYRLGWTKTYLSKAGLITSIKRGVYKITKEGKKVYKSGVLIDNHYLLRYPSFVNFFVPNHISIKSTRETNEENSTPNENLEESIRLINSKLSSELMEMIYSNTPQFFENLVLDLLDKMGYGVDEDSIIKTQYSNDEGIDGIIKEDKLGFSNIYVQAKKWKEKVGRPEIQKFLGAVAGYGGTKGLFITTSSFTNEAIKYANKYLQVKLILIDGEKLTDLMIKYGIGVSTVKIFELKEIDSDYFEENI